MGSKKSNFEEKTNVNFGSFFNIPKTIRIFEIENVAL